MDKLLKEISFYENLIEDLKTQKNNIEASMRLYKEKKDTLANKVIEEMQETGCDQAKLDGLTWSLRHNPPKPVITDESVIPEKFWKIKKEIDKTKMNAAAKLGEQVPGTVMDNGSLSLVCRATKSWS